MLGYVSHFIRILEKCASNIEELKQACLGSVEENFNKDIEELLSYIQIQYHSKVFTPHLHKHDSYRTPLSNSATLQRSKILASKQEFAFISI